MDKFEEYRFFAESTEKLSERRQNATQTYLTVNTGIFAILVFLVKDAGFKSWGLVFISLPLFLVGGTACIIWYLIIAQYKQLIAWRYKKLVEMERNGAVSIGSQIFMQEKEHFFSSENGKKSLGFSRLEQLLPVLFFSLYATYLLILAAGTIGGLF